MTANPHSTAPDAFPPAVDPAGLTVEAMAERLDRMYDGPSLSFAAGAVAYVLTGLNPGPERDAALSVILSRLAQRSAPAEGSDDAVTASSKAVEWLNRIHYGLMDPTRPRQACGEMVAGLLVAIEEQVAPSPTQSEADRG